MAEGLVATMGHWLQLSVVPLRVWRAHPGIIRLRVGGCNLSPGFLPHCFFSPDRVSMLLFFCPCCDQMPAEKKLKEGLS